MCACLAMISLKTGRSLVWGEDHGNILNDSEASAMLRRPYRGPWKYPEPIGACLPSVIQKHHTTWRHDCRHQHGTRYQLTPTTFCALL